MERRHLMSGLVALMTSCIAIMSLFPDSTIPNAIPVTLMFLCLVIMRMVKSQRQDDDSGKTDDDRPDSKPKS